MAVVVDFPGTTTADIPVDTVLDSAKECDDVLVIGWRDGDLYVAMSNSKISDAMLMVRCADRLLMDTLMAMTAE